MITFKPIVIPGNRRKDGTYPVKIRVTFRGKTRRLATTLVARQTDLSRSLHIKSPDILNRANELIKEMRAAVSDLSPFVIEGWDVDRVVAHIHTKLREENFALDFFAWSDSYLSRKSPSTRRAYDMALRAFERFLGRRTIDINDITKALLLDFVEKNDSETKMQYNPRTGEWIDTGKPRKGGASSRHLAKLAHLFNAAKQRYNDDDKILIPRSPFDAIPKPVPPSEGARALTSEELQMVIDSGPDFARDIFLLSFATMGANLADMYAAKPQLSRWVYNRRKTQHRRQDGAIMKVDIPGEVSGIIGRLQAGPAGWWLPALHRYSTCNGCTARVNAGLKEWATENHLPDTEHISFYSARKTWATIARKLGVEKALVDECLCHVGDYRMTDIYAERDFDLMNAANRKVIESFRWP